MKILVLQSSQLRRFYLGEKVSIFWALLAFLYLRGFAVGIITYRVVI